MGKIYLVLSIVGCLLLTACGTAAIEEDEHFVNEFIDSIQTDVNITYDEYISEGAKANYNEEALSALNTDLLADVREFKANSRRFKGDYSDDYYLFYGTLVKEDDSQVPVLIRMIVNEVEIDGEKSFERWVDGVFPMQQQLFNTTVVGFLERIQSGEQLNNGVIQHLGLHQVSYIKSYSYDYYVNLELIVMKFTLVDKSGLEREEILNFTYASRSGWVPLIKLNE